MNETIHVYRQRHIFKGDDLIGKYHVPTRTAHIFPDFIREAPKVKAHYLRNYGIIIKVTDLPKP